MFDALQCIAYLVKLPNKGNHISVGYVQTIAQKQLVLSVDMKLFEIQKLESYLINFTRILWFVWDLGLVLFDSQIDLEKILVFSNILGFLWVNWAQNWIKIINFGHVLFLPIFNSERLFGSCVFLMKNHWLKFHWTCVAQKLSKRGHFMDPILPQKYLKIYNLTTTNATIMI